MADGEKSHQWQRVRARISVIRILAGKDSLPARFHTGADSSLSLCSVAQRQPSKHTAASLLRAPLHESVWLTAPLGERAGCAPLTHIIVLEAERLRCALKVAAAQQSRERIRTGMKFGWQPESDRNPYSNSLPLVTLLPVSQRKDLPDCDPVNRSITTGAKLACFALTACHPATSSE